MGSMPDSAHVRLTIPSSTEDPRSLVGKMHEVVIRCLWPGARSHTHTVNLWISAIERGDGEKEPLAIGVAHFATGALDAAIPGDAFHIVGSHVHEAFAATGTIVAFFDNRPVNPNPGPRSLEASEAMVTFRRTAGTPTYPKVPGQSGALIALESLRTPVRGELTYEASRFHRGRMWFRLSLPAQGFAESSAGDQIEVLDCPAADWLVGADGRIELILENEGP